VTQRKLPFAPCLGHARLVKLLVDSQIDRPRLRFLEQDRGGLQRFAKAIEDIQFVARSARYGPAQSFSRNSLSQIITAPSASRKRRKLSLNTLRLADATGLRPMQFRMAAGEHRCCPTSLCAQRATLTRC